MRDDHALSYSRAMGVEPLSTSKCSVRTDVSALMETGCNADGVVSYADESNGILQETGMSDESDVDEELLSHSVHNFGFQ